MNKKTIAQQQTTRIKFKNWNVEEQRIFLKGLLEEHAYCCGYHNAEFMFNMYRKDMSKNISANIKMGLMHAREKLK